MKTTKIMVACIATFILSWLTASFIFFLLSSDTSFREVAGHGGMAMFLLIFGWIPSVVVGADLNDKIAD